VGLGQREGGWFVESLSIGGEVMVLNESIWYHGTNESSAVDICDVGVDFSKSKKELDFGIGFYLTDDIKVAIRRAFSQTKKYNRIHHKNENPAIVTVAIDEELIKDLTVKKYEYCNKEWVKFVLANRLSMKYLTEHNILEHNLDLRYDVVIGSIADSDVSGLAAHIEDGDLTFEDVSVYDVLTEKGTTLGRQMSLHTEKSLLSVRSKFYDVIEGRNK